MDNKITDLWKDFRLLSRQNPDCEAVRLTVELQRWFVGHKQQAFIKKVYEVLKTIDQNAVH